MSAHEKSAGSPQSDDSYSQAIAALRVAWTMLLRVALMNAGMAVASANADLSELMLTAATADNSYRAALRTTSTIDQRSLIDFLR